MIERAIVRLRVDTLKRLCMVVGRDKGRSDLVPKVVTE